MLQRIFGLIVSVVGVLVALFVGFWTLVVLAFVVVGAAIAHALRSRGLGRARPKQQGEVIEGEFSVVEEHRPGESGQGGQGKDGRPGPHSRP